MRYVFSCLAAAGALCLTACAGPGAPALPLTPPASLSGPLAQGQAAWPQGAWWRAFADPQLDALIERALADAPSMQLARARLRQAVAVGEQAGAALLPGAALNADVTRQRYSEHGMVPPPMAGSWRTSGQLSLDFAYDLDLAGGERARRDAAQDRAQAAGADEAGARLLLSAALTHAYWGLERLHALANLAGESQASAERAAALLGQRQRAGLAHAGELAAAQSQAAAARQEALALAEQITLQRHAIAALAGQGPALANTLHRPQLRAPAGDDLPTVLPAALLGRRPDIVAARWRVEAGGREVDSARAAFYPNINLLSFIGYSAIGMSQLLQSASRVAGLGPALSLPLFDGGARRAALAGAEAGRDAQIAQNNQTVLDAVREVADQAASLRALAAQSRQTDTAQTQAAAARHSAQMRARAGLASELDALALDAPWLAQRRQAVELNTRRQQARVGLIKALGGGYASSDFAENAQ
jgi:NodT family efflux transporter outer membrane factor (OMF) lipoprotein